MASSSSAPAPDTNEMYEEGVAAFKAKDYTKAAELLSEVVENLAALHGDLAPECADAYFQYGRALLMEVEEKEEQEGGQDVLGGNMPKEVPTGAEPVKEEEGSSSASGKGKAEAVPEGEEGGEDEEEDEEDGEEGGDAPEGGAEEGGGGGANAKDAEEGGEEGGAPGGEEAEMSDDPLQLAWEVLDVARKIYEQEGGDEVRLSDVYAFLGDINLRNELFDASLSNYQSCLALREEVCKPDDRLLIEIHHQLAMAAINHATPDRVAAIKSYKEAVRVCELRIANLDKLMALPDPAAPDASVPDSSVQPKARAGVESEKNEIDAIAEEMRARIESEETVDPAAAGASSTGGAANPFGVEALKALAAASGLGGASANFGAFGPGLAGVDAAVPVKTLGVFGKKKRPPADSTPAVAAAGEGEGKKAEGEEPSAKKAKTESLPPSDNKTSGAATPASTDQPTVV